MRCSKIITNETMPNVNDTRRACVDFKYTDFYRVTREAKLCCCSGSDYCNSQIDWSDSAHVLENNLVIEDDNDQLSGSSAWSVLTITEHVLVILFVQTCLILAI